MNPFTIFVAMGAFITFGGVITHGDKTRKQLALLRLKEKLEAPFKAIQSALPSFNIFE